ncbi:MAG: FAD-dependent oxidoreductase, partial [Syntrophaceticus sp.]
MGNAEKPKTGFSRRTFIKGAAFGAAGVAASGLLVGCGGKNGSTEEKKETDSDEKGKLSFEETPKPIPDSEIKETVDADVVVVGAGLSGLCAAISAAEEGAKVVLLEKTDNVN